MGERIRANKGRVLQRAAVHGRAVGQAKQRRFLEHLAATCNVAASAKAAGASAGPFYKLRQREPSFAAAWKAAMDAGYDRLEEALLAKALADVEPVAFDPAAIETVLVNDREDGVPADVAELRQLLAAWRDAKRSAWRAACAWLAGSVDDAEAARLVSGGALAGLSVGYRPLATRQGARRELVRVDLVEVSLVAIPMQPLARIDQVSSEENGNG